MKPRISFEHLIGPITPRPDWARIAGVVSRRYEKTYSARYVREVATGRRRNEKVRFLLKFLGLIQKPKTVKQASKAVAA